MCTLFWFAEGDQNPDWLSTFNIPHWLLTVDTRHLHKPDRVSEYKMKIVCKRLGIFKSLKAGAFYQRLELKIPAFFVFSVSVSTVQWWRAHFPGSLGVQHWSSSLAHQGKKPVLQGSLRRKPLSVQCRESKEKWHFGCISWRSCHWKLAPKTNTNSRRRTFCSCCKYILNSVLVGKST